jgi:hypothetical protein
MVRAAIWVQWRNDVKPGSESEKNSPQLFFVPIMAAHRMPAAARLEGKYAPGTRPRSCPRTRGG